MRIVAVSGEPELAPIVAGWLWQAFFQYPGAMDERALTSIILSPPPGPEETFVLLEGDTPVGTASLTSDDLPARPDLTPWLAGVFVRPEFRGRGHARALVRWVEDHARSFGVGRLWLNTGEAEGLYAGLGWHRVEAFELRSHPNVLMRRDLAQ